MKLNQGKIFSDAIERHEEEDSKTQAGAPPLDSEIYNNMKPVPMNGRVQYKSS